jgi:multiple sugar transport system permease protein
MTSFTLPTPEQTNKRSILRRAQVTGLLLIAPWFVGFLLLKLLPILASLAISFTDIQMLHPERIQFIGLENYWRFFRDADAGFVLFATFALAISTIPLQIAAALMIAYLLNNPQLKARTALRTLFFLPSIIPSIAITFMWFGFTDPNTGWLSRFILEPLGLGGDLFTESAASFLFAVSSLWSIGPGLLIMLGAMQGISPELHEAARVDGAGPFVRFFSITLPMISPAIFFALVIDLISVFGGVVLLDRGNNFNGGTSPYDGYLSFHMFNRLDLGYAATLAWIFFVLVIVATVILFRTSRYWVFYADAEK